MTATQTYTNTQAHIPRYFMNGLNNFHKTDKKYSLASIDELITFRRSEVKVTAGRRGPIM